MIQRLISTLILTFVRVIIKVIVLKKLKKIIDIKAFYQTKKILHSAKVNTVNTKTIKISSFQFIQTTTAILLRIKFQSK